LQSEDLVYQLVVDVEKMLRTMELGRTLHLNIWEGPHFVTELASGCLHLGVVVVPLLIWF